MFSEHVQIFKIPFENRGNLDERFEKCISSYYLRREEHFETKKIARARKKILPFAAQSHPALLNLKNIPMGEMTPQN